MSLRQGLQAGLHQLGAVPRDLRMDNSSAATHRIGTGAERDFNAEFVSLCAHYDLVPKTIGIGCPNENGDVESSNRHLKRRLRQHLLLRGSREFVTEAAYEAFLVGVLQGATRAGVDREALGMATLGAVGEPSGGFSASHRCKLENPKPCRAANAPWVRPDS